MLVFRSPLIYFCFFSIAFRCSGLPGISAVTFILKIYDTRSYQSRGESKKSGMAADTIICYGALRRFKLMRSAVRHPAAIMHGNAASEAYTPCYMKAARFPATSRSNTRTYCCVYLERFLCEKIHHNICKAHSI